MVVALKSIVGAFIVSERVLERDHSLTNISQDQDTQKGSLRGAFIFSYSSGGNCPILSEMELVTIESGRLVAICVLHLSHQYLGDLFESYLKERGCGSRTRGTYLP